MLTFAERPNTLMPESPVTPNTSAPCVAFTVTVSAAPSPSPFGPRRSSSMSVTPRPGEVADRDVVGAAERAKLDRLHMVEVHRDAGDVADEAGETYGDRRDADVL